MMPYHFLYRYLKLTGLLIVLSLHLHSCKPVPSADIEVNSEEEIRIFPDYANVAIPPNIAPLNFRIENKDYKNYFVRIFSTKGDTIFIKAEKNSVKIPLKKWQKLLEKNTNEKLYFSVLGEKDGLWHQLPLIENQIVEDKIDPCVVYRIISPGDRPYHFMGIYQRHLHNFREEAIYRNDLLDNACINCHNFCQHDPNTMMMHNRFEHAGTVVQRNGEVNKYQLFTPAGRKGIYPTWHPGGRYLAFSTNDLSGAYYILPERRVLETYDVTADIFVLDLDSNRIFSSPDLLSEDNQETFPRWSPDGKYLYYSSSPHDMSISTSYENLKTIRYNLSRIPFDAETQTFGEPEIVLSGDSLQRSISWPTFSPDGRYLAFCVSDFGTVTATRPSTDIWTLDLQTLQIDTMPIVNGYHADSYHSFSSNGRWLAVSSKRMDGVYTRTYFAYFDKNGHYYKPFVMPMEDPGFYESFLQLYNIPEFVREPIETSMYEFVNAGRGKGIEVRSNFDDTKQHQNPVDATSGASIPKGLIIQH